MARIINICSGKGGVGKTTIAANLGAALQKLDQKVAVIDCNLTTSHLSLYLGMYSFPNTLNSFLKNESKLEDAVYKHSSGISFVPASLNIKDLVNVDVSRLKDTIKQVFSEYNIVLIDSAPGLGKEAMISLQISDEVLFIANPFIPSVVDISKCKQVIEGMDSKLIPIGIILNRVKNKKYELTKNEVRQFVELPVIGVVPEDENVLKGVNKKELVTISNNKSPASKAFFSIASYLTGVQYEKPRFSWWPFRRKAI